VQRKLLKRLEWYLKRSRTSPTRFGLDFIGDPTLVFELRRGRVARPPMEARLVAFLDHSEKALKDMTCHRR
jgi:hypothetical protein